MRIIILIFSALFLLSCLQEGSELMGYQDKNLDTTAVAEEEGIYGRLLLNSGEPAAGAQVELWPVSDNERVSLTAKTVTDEDGKYMFYNLSSGIYNLIGSWSHQPDNMQAVFIDNQAFKSVLDAGETIMAGTGNVRIKVHLNSIPEEGIECYILGTGFSDLSDNAGECLMENIPPGTYDLVYRLPGFSLKKTEGIKVDTDKTEWVESVWFQLDPAQQDSGNDPGISDLDNTLFPFTDGSVVFAGDTLYVEGGKFRLHDNILELVDMDTVFMQVDDFLKKVYVFRVRVVDKNDNDDEPEIIEIILETIPEMPADPYPVDRAGDISLAATLAWSPLNLTVDHKVKYDVYFGTGSNPSDLVSWKQTVPYQTLSNLEDGVTYYWRIAAYAENVTVLGPVWSFTTRHSPPENMRPELPLPVFPRNNAVAVDTMQVRLEWSSGDLDADDVLLYDVYVSVEKTSLIKIATGLQDSSFVVSNLDPNTTYTWQITGSDGMATTAGPVWRFTTMSGVCDNQAPVVPGSPGPKFGVSHQDNSLNLSWIGGDLDEYDSVFYEVYLGTENPPTGKMVSHYPRTGLYVSGLTAGTLYYWQVIATDGMDTIAGPVWNFSTTPEGP